MRQLNEHHSFTGMQRDIGVSKHPSSYLYDARNIRLTSRGEDTLLTITNEKGPLDTNIAISGFYLGHCLMGDYLVIFSTNNVSSTIYTKAQVRAKSKYIQSLEKGNKLSNHVIISDIDDSILPWKIKDIAPYTTNKSPKAASGVKSNTEPEGPDYITRINLSTGESLILYEGNLKFSTKNPIEAIASYENENIQKVYWTDGLNQPRMINIVGNILEGVDSQFDFIRELSLKEEVEIQKQVGTPGSFAPGVIQYALTYYSKYGQESNIFYTSPLLYISHKDRGGSPEDKISNSFKITVKNLDKNFDYLRIYSIQRTSINNTPIVKRIQDINIKALEINLLDKDYVTSKTQPTILVDGNYRTPDSYSFSYYTRKPFLSHNLPFPIWYGYLKSAYPNLIIKTEEGYVTWGKASTDSSILWVSQDKFRTDGNEYGYQICETSVEDTTEKVSFTESESLLGKVSFIDNGTIGDSIDPVELLYKGGESVIAETLEQKDNTLFLGNLTLSRPSLMNLKGTIKEAVNIENDTRTFFPLLVSSGYYEYSNQLTSFADIEKTISVPCGGFKRGDYYRCGVQFQYKDGKWSDPIWIKDQVIENHPSYSNSSNVPTVTVPTLKGTLTGDVTTTLYNKGYRKARAVVVFPSLQDRVTICQGVGCPTMYTTNSRSNGLYAQSSWFFRPNYGQSVQQIGSDSVAPFSAPGELPYTQLDLQWNPENIKQVEIQGAFDPNDRFRIDYLFSTLHSPDVEFDNSLSTYNFINVNPRRIGKVVFSSTLSDIDIQTETPTIGLGGGFQHKSYTKYGIQGIVSGPFYKDNLVFDISADKLIAGFKGSQRKWIVYPWHRTGSLNNDMDRPSGMGTRTAVLKKKVISNLRYAKTELAPLEDYWGSGDIQLFNSDQTSIVKLGDQVYQGNIDTLLSPSSIEGIYCFLGSALHKTYNATDTTQDNNGEYYWSNVWIKYDWTEFFDVINPGNNLLNTVIHSEPVRMKYKSSPHLVLSNVPTGMSDLKSDESALPIIELIKKGDNGESFYRSTMFGGSSEDALKANIWIPCGEPVKLGSSYDGTPTDGATKIQYSYGDTYYQRWDCLKTYPFTPEDINQIVEIGSFMLETRINIDGRYDRNRGQSNNLNMTPQNFNLLNPVYTQTNNFFTYRILDKNFYNINHFPNQITWTKEKQAGANVDLWTNLSLTSTYDMDGSKGAVNSLNVWKDQIFCFQDRGVSNVLFNSRVQIPVSDGIPIEISNSYKVDGCRYLSDGIGCNNKWTISNTPSGVYFIDSINNHLYHIGEGIQDITTTHNMTSWFKDIDNNEVISTLYDKVNHDLYLVVPEIIDKEGDIVKRGEVLCYSEILGQFTSFLDYDNINLIEAHNSYIYTMRNSRLYFMFKGSYNNFFGDQRGWNFTFISNGVDNSTMDFDKIFSNIDYRMDIFDDASYNQDKTFDYIEVSNEYQDTEEVALSRLKIGTNPKSYHHKDANLQKKFRIWRIQIPRNKNSLDRIRNPWCKIKLGNNGSDNSKAVLHDLNVQYYL